MNDDELEGKHIPQEEITRMKKRMKIEKQIKKIRALGCGKVENGFTCVGTAKTVDFGYLCPECMKKINNLTKKLEK